MNEFLRRALRRAETDFENERLSISIKGNTLVGVYDMSPPIRTLYSDEVEDFQLVVQMISRDMNYVDETWSLESISPLSLCWQDRMRREEHREIEVKLPKGMGRYHDCFNKRMDKYIIPAVNVLRSLLERMRLFYEGILIPAGEMAPAMKECGAHKYNTFMKGRTYYCNINVYEFLLFISDPTLQEGAWVCEVLAETIIGNKGLALLRSRHLIDEFHGGKKLLPNKLLELFSATEDKLHSLIEILPSKKERHL